MFKEWGFLLTEIWVLIALALLVGLVAGWLIWGGRNAAKPAAATADAETARLRADLSACQAALAQCRSDAQALAAQQVQVIATPEPVADAGVQQRPAALAAARDGQPDDLKLIKGIGPQMEKLCNSLGFFHFDQIAAWTDAEIAWVDNNLEGFKGRVTRDQWVAQARDLAAGLPPRPMAENPLKKT
jgi:predicted flap endonuclease-1-like 5' DNA nuclease